MLKETVLYGLLNPEETSDKVLEWAMRKKIIQKFWLDQ